MARQAVYLYAKKKLGFNHEKDEEGFRKEGLAMVIADKRANAIRNFGSMFKGRTI